MPQGPKVAEFEGALAERCFGCRQLAFPDLEMTVMRSPTKDIQP